MSYVGLHRTPERRPISPPRDEMEELGTLALDRARTPSGARLDAVRRSGRYSSFVSTRSLVSRGSFTGMRPITSGSLAPDDATRVQTFLRRGTEQHLNRVKTNPHMVRAQRTLRRIQRDTDESSRSVTKTKWSAVKDQIKIATPSTPAGKGDALVQTFERAEKFKDDPDSIQRSRWDRFKIRWNELAAILRLNVTNSSWFTAFIMGFIGVAALSVAIQIYTDTLVFLEYVDEVVLWAFVTEAILKILAEGTHPHRYFLDRWNMFDFVVVILSLVPQNGVNVSVIRTIRLLRVLKVVRNLPQLRILVLSLFKSLGSLGYITILLFLVFYLYAVLCVTLLGENDPAHFDNLHIAMLSLFRIATGDDWTDIMYIGMLGCDEYGYDTEQKFSEDGFRAQCVSPAKQPVWTIVLLISFTFLTSFILINVIIGVIVASVAETAVEERCGVDVELEIVRCRSLVGADVLGKSDPYVVVKCGPDYVRRTAVRKDTVNPRWFDAKFRLPSMEDLGYIVRLEVYDWDRFSQDDLLGYAVLDLEPFPFDIEITMPIVLQGAPHGSIEISFKKVNYQPVRDLTDPKLDHTDRLLMRVEDAEDLWEDIRLELRDEIRERRRIQEEVTSNESLQKVMGQVMKFLNTMRRPEEELKGGPRADGAEGEDDEDEGTRKRRLSKQLLRAIADATSPEAYESSKSLL